MVLTELLLEINAHTRFADEFFHASEASARVDDLPVSISAVLMAEACNIGLEPLMRSNIPVLTRHRLNWTKANYLRAETITSANARLVDFQATLPLAQVWGGGEVASADGIRFVYTDGQEDQLGALGLVTNAVVLWNTIYMQAALDHLRKQGETVNDEDIARLSPLCHGHINMLGHYSFTLAELVTKGHLRPLKEVSEEENIA